MSDQEGGGVLTRTLTGCWVAVQIKFVLLFRIPIRCLQFILCFGEAASGEVGAGCIENLYCTCISTNASLPKFDLVGLAIFDIWVSELCLGD